MNLKKREAQFLDYLEDKLCAEEKSRFQQDLDNSSELRQSFESYSKLIKFEGRVRDLKQLSPEDFTEQVLVQLARNRAVVLNRGWIFQEVKELYMRLFKAPKFALGGLATVALLLICMKVGLELSPSEIVLKNYLEKERVAAISNEMGAQKPESIETAPLVSAATSASENGQALRGKSQNLPAPTLLVPEEEIRRSAQDQLKNGARRDRDQRESKGVAVINDLLSSREAGSDAGNIEGYVKYKNREGEQEKVIVNGKVVSRAPKSESAVTAVIPDLNYRRNNLRCSLDTCSETYVPPSTDTAQYNEYQENAFTDVAQEAMSTFSIDVDTASYSNARRFLQAGSFPPQEAIRIEEFINYFDYNYPSQTEKPFAASYEIAPSPLKPDRFLLKLGIKARESLVSEVGWNLVFLVDVSGSMQPDNRLPLVKKALKILVEKMRPHDRIALVTYAGVACNPLGSTPGTEKTRILAAIDELGAGGSTNGSGGINLAYEIAERNLIKNGVNRVILATDGDFNVGVSSQNELISMIEEKRKGGVTLTTIGVGDDNLHDGTLEQLADRGNGNYFYLDTLREARKVMESDLTKNMEVVAKDVKLQLEFNPKHVKQYRLVGYDNRKLANIDFNNDKIDAGEIGPGHTVTAIYELVLADSNVSLSDSVSYRYQKQVATPQVKIEGDESFSKELAFLKIRYKEPAASDSKLLQYTIETDKIQKNLEQVSSDFKFAAAVSYFAELLRHSRYAGSMTYQQIAELAQKTRGEDSRGYRQEFIELVKNAAVLAPGTRAVDR